MRFVAVLAGFLPLVVLICGSHDVLLILASLLRCNMPQKVECIITLMSMNYSFTKSNSLIVVHLL